MILSVILSSFYIQSLLHMTEYIRIARGGLGDGGRERGIGVGGKCMCVCLSVCVSVCVSVCDGDFSKNYWADYNQTSPVIMKCALVVRFVKS